MKSQPTIDSAAWDKAAQSLRGAIPLWQDAALRARMRRLLMSVPSAPQFPKRWGFHFTGINMLAWIATGCPWFDEAGGCAVCDGYGKHPDFDPPTGTLLDETIEEALAFIEDDSLKALREGRNIYAVNLGSAMTLHERSLPRISRLKLFRGAGKILQPFIARGAHATYRFESRLSDINAQSLQELRECIAPNIRVEIGVGIEAVNDFVRETLLNKGYPIDALGTLRQTVDLAARYNVGLEAHIVLGSPFLTELESLVSAVESVEAVLGAGVCGTVLMTTNIKSASYLGNVLYRMGRFSPVSIHATIEALNRLYASGSLKAFPMGFEASDPILRRAQGCPQCTERLSASLRTLADLYSEWGPAKGAEFFRTQDWSCACREQWLGTLQAPALPLIERFRGEFSGLEKKLGDFIAADAPGA
ncbi:MAG: hypothetical protein AAB036_05365 [Elusimicrobiota bacterium]